MFLVLSNSWVVSDPDGDNFVCIFKFLLKKFYLNIFCVAYILWSFACF